MAKREMVRKFDDVLGWLREHGFELQEPAGTTGRVFLRKLNCAAAIERDPDGGARLFAKPGYVVNGEITKLVDKGYQKFLKTSKAEVPATADQLKAVHQFGEELREALGRISLYNESLGSVSDAYTYDRVYGREEGEKTSAPWKEKESAAQSRAEGKKRA